jgi:hypothetical protein
MVCGLLSFDFPVANLPHHLPHNQGGSSDVVQGDHSDIYHRAHTPHIEWLPL